MTETRSIVYKYGMLPPMDEFRERAMQALRDAHTLYNQALAVHRSSYEDYTALDEGFPEILALREQRAAVLKEHWDRVSLINEMRRTKPAGALNKEEHAERLKTLQEEAKALTEKQKALTKELKALREVRDADPEVAQALVDRDNARKAKLKSLRQASPLECTTVTAVLDSAQQASGKAQGQPKFRRWTGEGSLFLQLPQGVSTGTRYQVPHLIQTNQPPAKVGPGPNPFVQIDPVDPRAWDRGLTKGQRKYHQRTRLRFRVAHQGRTPLWAEFPMMMHRPFPEGALACGVSITCRKVGPKEVWSVQFTLKVPDKGELPLPTSPKGVAIDWGWRKKPEGYRVAYWADTEGDHGEVILPAEIISKIEHADSIESIRDKNLDVLRSRLLADLKGKRDQLSPDLRERVKALHQWRAPSRFAALWFKHRGELPLSDMGAEEAFRADPHLSKYSNYFEAWLHRDRHLWQYEAGARRSAYARRNHIYQNWAAALAAKYDLIVCEDIKVANLATKAAPENKADIPEPVAAMNNASSRQRSRAAVGIFRNTVIHAAVSARKMVVKADAKNTSRIHHACGNKIQVGAQLNPTCSHCGVTYDRDWNAALNILARGMVAAETPEALAKVTLKAKQGVSKRKKARVAGKEAAKTA